MFCPNCGRKVNDDAKFCLNCGHQFQLSSSNKIEYIISPITTEIKNDISISDVGISLTEQKSILYIIKTKLKKSTIDRNMIQNIQFSDNSLFKLVQIIISIIIIPCIVSIGIIPVFNFMYSLVLGKSQRHFWDPNMLDVWNESVYNQGILITLWTFISLMIVYVLLNIYFNLFLNNSIKIKTANDIYRIKINIFNKKKYNEIKNQIVK